MEKKVLEKRGPHSVSSVTNHLGCSLQTVLITFIYMSMDMEMEIAGFSKEWYNLYPS